ncbi:MAG: hypothetical protein LUG94_01345 [Ruminococcus sp.]|nr:hypothetical protein [Ruminococcus sp.]
MKSLKKVLFGLVATTMLGTLTLVPISTSAVLIQNAETGEVVEQLPSEDGSIPDILVINTETGEIVEQLPGEDGSIPDVTIGESEDSITEFTIGDSVYPRGDINLDGKTNTADLLYLKKYLLGLIEW